MELFTIFLCFIALSFVFLLTLLVYAMYSGLFFIINVGAGPPPIKNVQVAYKFSRGPYRNCHTFFTEVTSLAPKSRCVGIYYDDPQKVPSERLRWAVGTILSEGDAAPDGELLRLVRSKGYRVARLPAVSNAVKCTFPYNTFLSVIIAIFRVYPLMGEYVRINKLCAHPYLEIYDGCTIHFMAPLAKQDEFYVPEASLDPGEELEEEEGEGQGQGQSEGQGQKSPEVDVDKTGSKVTDKDEEKEVKDRETSSKQKVTDSSGKRSESEEVAASEGSIQDSGVSSTAAPSGGGGGGGVPSDTSLSPSPEPRPLSHPSSAQSASDASLTISETSALSTTTDTTDASLLSTEGSLLSSGTDDSLSAQSQSALSEGALSRSESAHAESALAGFSSESDTEPFEVVRKEDVK